MRLPPATPIDAPTVVAELIDAVCAVAAGVHGDVTDVVVELVDRLSPLAGPAVRQSAIAGAVARLDGLDALQQHLKDPDVDEVMVNAGNEIWLDRRGAIERAGRLTPGTLAVILERVLASTGKRIDRTNPIVDVRLPDGARLCAVIEPIAVDGATVSIRRHRTRPMRIDEFAAEPGQVDLLRTVVAARCNILVSGATSSGKTSFVGALLALTEVAERVVICEDTTELSLPGRHTIRLEARPAGADGLPAVDLSALVRTALRLRPDRLVVGEFRGVEVLAAVEAMNTGHDGSISTCHANSAVDALRRVETLLIQAAPSWPLIAIRRQVSRSIDIVVHLERDSGGQRRVAEIAEVVEGDVEPAVHLLDPAGAGSAQLSRRRRADTRGGR